MAEPSPKRRPGEPDPSLAEQHRYWNARWDRSRTPNEWQLRQGDAILRFVERLPLDPRREPRRREEVVELHGERRALAGRVERLEVEHPDPVERRRLDRPHERAGSGDHGAGLAADRPRGLNPNGLPRELVRTEYER